MPHWLNRGLVNPMCIITHHLRQVAEVGIAVNPVNPPASDVLDIQRVDLKFAL